MHLAANQVEFEEYTAKVEQMKAAGEKCEDTPVVRLVEFESILGFNMEPEVLEDAGLIKSTRFHTFPPYLLVHVQREVPDPATMRPMKLDVNVPMPDEFDLSAFRSTGLQEGEVEMEEVPEAAAPQPPCDPAVVQQLMDMGFPEARCRKAVIATDNNGVEVAMGWIMEHMDDPEEPAPAAAAPGMNEEAIANLMAMGFERPKCVKALRECDGDAGRAVEWMFSHPDDDGSDEAPASVSPQDGSGKYELVGFVSHVGKNTECGHYVAHIKKDGKWLFFNDEKVVFSQNPPRDCGHLYLYHQV